MAKQAEKPAVKREDTEPPVGFGYIGKFADLPEEVRDVLQEQWDALTSAQQEKQLERCSHLRYDHKRFLAENA